MSRVICSVLREGDVGLVQANLSELNGRVNHWTDFLQECPREKIKFFRGKLNEPDCAEVETFLRKMSSRASTQTSKMLCPSCLYLGAHLGFAVRPRGYLFRQLEPKMFFADDDGVQAFYVSQSFDAHVAEFRRTDPVIMLEGVLDVEVFSEITGYPYVMGYLTSSVPHNLAMMMAMLANRVILVPDNDAGGKKNWAKDNLPHSVSFLKRFGVKPDVLQFEEFKDFGDVWKQKEMHSLIRAKVNAVV